MGHLELENLIMLENKICKNCGTVFAKDRCRICANKASKKYRELNVEKVRESVKKWASMNKDKNNKKAKAWYHKNKDKCRERSRIYRQNNKDKINKARNEWYAKNKERLKPKMIAYREKNIEAVRARVRRWHKANPDKVRSNIKRYEERYPEKKKIVQMNTNRRRRNAPGKISHGIVDRLNKLQKNKCACCKISLKKVKVHLDHIQPISKGGSNTDDNIQILCSSCNLTKSSKHPIDFMQEKGFLL